MFLAELNITNFRHFGDPGLTVRLREGLTALVGENDTGKTAVIDALRFVLGTRDQEWLRIEPEDFHISDGSDVPAPEMRISCRFEGLTLHDKAAFAEYLTYGTTEGTDAALNLTWTARQQGERRGRPYVATDIRSGKDGDGPTLAHEAKALLAATYLRPLRDAERELSAGRGSRLSQVLHALKGIDAGDKFDPETDLATLVGSQIQTFSLLALGDFFNKILGDHPHVQDGRDKVDVHLAGMQLHGDGLKSSISVSNGNSETIRQRQLLEKLSLGLSGGAGRLGLGSNNLLFMACELLLLATEREGFPLLLIEEPEAHVHAQRQLRLIQYLQEMAGTGRNADGQKPQIIITTHSPNLASDIKLDNLVILQGGKAYPMARGETELDDSDYRFLERFLDVTKANLFFARGVMIVEGDAENLLIPTLAKLIGKDFTTHGVSIVNVGGTGLRRYARIFMRKHSEREGSLDVPVACLADFDVMPDCAVEVIKKDLPTKEGLGTNGLADRKAEIRAKASGQRVGTFVADEWTLEYDLAHANENSLAADVFIAARLAKWEGGTKEGNIAQAGSDFATLRDEATATAKENGWSAQEVLATAVYAEFTKSGVSKAITAQYLSERLEKAYGEASAEKMRKMLPPYIVAAIDHVTPQRVASKDGGEDRTHEDA